MKNNKLQFTQEKKKSHTRTKKILECRKKILPKILCGCANPITSNMAPTDHCRTQPQTEQRIGRNSNER